jgi:hypothetical protein
LFMRRAPLCLYSKPSRSVRHFPRSGKTSSLRCGTLQKIVPPATGSIGLFKACRESYPQRCHRPPNTAPDDG